MPSVLVVDDSTTDRRVVGFLLKSASEWQIDYAFHGQEALDKMDVTKFDLVLTDLLMPRVNGLELVAAMRSKHPTIPVILMTSRGSEGVAMTALREGATCYIPKRFLPRKLLETIGRVMAVSCRPRSYAPLVGALLESYAKFRLNNDIRQIQSLVVYLQERVLLKGACDETGCTQLGVALQEALLNALYHGNLQVGASSGLNDAEHAALIAERSKTPPYCDRHINVSVTLAPDRETFVIRDEGQGFDTSQLPNPTDISALEKTSGRGVILMRLFFDEVTYDSTGREVTLVRLHRPPRPPRKDA